MRTKMALGLVALVGACEDTPGWNNGGPGYNCTDYVTNGWCCDGGACAGQEWTLGGSYNNPEQNCCACGKGKARLRSYYADNMVFQRDRAPCFAGFADEGEQVTVDMAGQSASGIVGADGEFKICLPDTLPVGGPYEAVVTSGSEQPAVLRNVMSGDVILCSGQSNMQHRTDATFEFEENGVDDIEYPNIRMLYIQRVAAFTPQSDVSLTHNWMPSVEENRNQVHSFSAVCYFYGRELSKRLGSDVPIGLIHSSWGGTRIEAWMSPEALATCDGDEGDSADTEWHADETIFDEIAEAEAERVMAAANMTVADSRRSLQNANDASALYNAMIHPLLPLAIRTTLWYQGESNAGAPNFYQCAQPAMIVDWRQRFEDSSRISFLFVQLAAFNSGGNWGDFRWYGQTLSQASMQPTGQAIAIDGADPGSPFGDIHPRGKLPLAQRLERLAAVVEYGFAGVQAEGPVALSIVQQSSLDGTDTYVVNFSEAGNFIDPRGCVACCAGGSVFEGLVGNSWQPMTTMNLSGSFISLSIDRSEGQPVVSSVRYAWAQLPECIMMSAGSELPAAPFLMDVAKLL